MRDGLSTVLALTRIVLGWMFLYAGIVKFTDPDWTSLPYFQNSEILPELYQWFALAENIQWVDLANTWGLILIGAGLIIGFQTRLASFFGITLMILYYLPILDFPYTSNGAFLVDQHIIYILVFIILIAGRAGDYMGFDGRIS